ncbi:hypothetical protein EDB85DRAFT_1893700 [Lactarius pseudohatsudake]|nr:hypothetical protein EDB85DRAFT_1893700 [Lactarius pseudohatsudake]
MLAGPWVAAGVVPQQLCGDGTIVAEWTSGDDQIASPTPSRFHFPSVWQGFSNPHGYSPKGLGGYGSGTDHKQPDVLMPPPPCAFKPPSCTLPRRYDTNIVARKPCCVAATPRQRHASPAGCYNTSMAYEPRHVTTTPTQWHASPAGRSNTGTACEPRCVATTPTQQFLPPPSTLLYTCTRLKPTSDVRYLLWRRHTCRLLAIVERGPLLGPLWCLIAT